MSDRKAPRQISDRDRDLAREYARRNLSDPFAYYRALSRLAHGIFTDADLSEGVCT